MKPYFTPLMLFKNLTFFFIFINLTLSSHLCNLVNADSEEHDENTFTYEEGSDRGPKKWGKLNPHWGVCGTGKLQSPIDLFDERVQVVPSLGELKRDYKPAPASIKNRGHDIAMFWKGDAGDININGTSYKLIQCHWHSPSEHTINGSRYDLELHAVHQSNDGKIAVIGIVYKYGRPDPLLQRLLEHIQTIEGTEEKELGIVNPGVIKFGSRKYYRYIGSLTVPPCTEGVIWTIVEKVRTVSMEQVHVLRDKVHDGYEANARPLQELGGRPIWFYKPKMDDLLEHVKSIEAEEKLGIGTLSMEQVHAFRDKVHNVYEANARPIQELDR